jgi:enhancing lycopene biosynthesis protein 2
VERVGILLGGCGVYDGTEVHESVLVELALERRGARTLFLAPEGAQADVVDHTSGSSEREAPRRDLLVESARLSRGRIEALRPESWRECAALVVPGGFGAAKNLMTGLLEPGRPRRARPEVEEALRGLHEAGRPLGAVSLGQAVVAAALGRALPESFGAVPADGQVVDEEMNLVATPGHMSGEPLPRIAVGVEAMVEELLARCRRQAGRLPARGGPP